MPDDYERWRFRPGQAKPEGSGIKKGGEWESTKARKARDMKLIEDLRADFKRLKFATPQEIFDDFEFDPLIAMVRIARDYDDEPMVQLKWLETLVKLKYPTVKSVETRSATVSESRVQVSFGRDFPDDQRAAAAKAAVIEHEQVIPAIDLGSGEAPEKAKRPRGRPRKERP